jgi:hypothetical protein
LLIGNGFVDNNPTVKSMLAEKFKLFTILDACPVHVSDCEDIEACWKISPEMDFDAFIKQDFHAARAEMNRSPMA